MEDKISCGYQRLTAKNPPNTFKQVFTDPDYTAVSVMGALAGCSPSIHCSAKIWTALWLMKDIVHFLLQQHYQCANPRLEWTRPPTCQKTNAAHQKHDHTHAHTWTGSWCAEWWAGDGQHKAGEGKVCNHLWVLESWRHCGRVHFTLVSFNFRKWVGRLLGMYTNQISLFRYENVIIVPFFLRRLSNLSFHISKHEQCVFERLKALLHILYGK